MKAFVLTSSRVAVYNPEYGKDGEYPLTTFSDYFYDLGKAAKDDDPVKPVLACKRLTLLFKFTFNIFS